MPVTFRSKAYENITMVRKDADKLLEMMGHSGTIPSALSAGDIPGALERLTAALASVEAQEAAEPKAADTGDGYEDSERKKEKVGISLRAWPLIQMLEASLAADASVMWD